MAALEQSNEPVEQKLNPTAAAAEKDEILSKSQFRWLMNEDAMATEKLAEGIRNFAVAR